MIAAIVPAAGRSARMGRPKLTLPLGGSVLIVRVIEALRGGGVDTIVVVGPPAGFEGSAELSRTIIEADARLVRPPAPTADMRASIELGLADLEAGPAPEAVLIAPGDSPGLSADLVGLCLGRARAAPGSIVVPSHAGKRGHPLLLPWRIARTIRDLPEGAGVNALLAAHAESILVFEVPEAGAVADLDTPDDYRRWSARLGG